MKKAFILGILIVLISYIANSSTAQAFTQQESKAMIKQAIAKYKEKNYLGCISDLKIYTEVDPENAVAWNYLGSSYMNIAMKDNAKMAFDQVITLNTVPQLTSYSVQAKLCMDDPTKCRYQNFNYEEIQKLKENPVNFFNELLNAKPKVEIKDEDIVEIDKLIDGEYGGNVHPEAKAFIDQERIKIEQSKMNASRLNEMKSNPKKENSKK